MRQIAVICTFFLVLMFAVVGCLYIFDVMAFDAARSVALKFAAGIVLLGVCAAALTALVGGKKGQQD